MAELLIEKGCWRDIDELAELYGALCDHLQAGENYPGWEKERYPTRNNAENGLRSDCLFVARSAGVIAGTVILNNLPEPAYADAAWAFDSDYSDVLVVHTLAVHPEYLGAGVGRALIEFAVEYAATQGMRAVRLDTYAKNWPAIRLYERCGFQCTGTVDLGLGQYGLDSFRTFEKLVQGAPR